MNDDDLLFPDGSRLPLMESKCDCRSWPVYGYFGLRPCGYCGVVPILTGRRWADRDTSTREVVEPDGGAER